MRSSELEYLLKAVQVGVHVLPYGCGHLLGRAGILGERSVAAQWHCINTLTGYADWRTLVSECFNTTWRKKQVR